MLVRDSSDIYVNYLSVFGDVLFYEGLSDVRREGGGEDVFIVFEVVVLVSVRLVGVVVFFVFFVVVFLFFVF